MSIEFPADRFPEDAEYTVWWWDERDAQHIPFPQACRTDTKSDAIRVAHEIAGKPHITWVKAFRSDNELYQVFLWDREQGLVMAHPVAASSTATTSEPVEEDTDGDE